MNKLHDILKRTPGLEPPARHRRCAIGAADWEAAVGSRIARRAQPWRLERRVLTVRVNSAAWANELALLSDDILAQLVARGFAIDKLRFAVGPLGAGAAVDRQPPRRAIPKVALPAELSQQVAAIDDEGLRRAIGEAAATSLGAGQLFDQRENSASKK